MTNKYYAVYSGKVPGIFTTWEEAKGSVNHFSGALYKSFPTFEQAIEWLTEISNNAERNDEEVPDKVREIVNKAKPIRHVSKSKVNSNNGIEAIKEASPISEAGGVHLYTDGSYDKESKTYAWAYVLTTDTEELIYFDCGKSIAGEDNMWQVSGEIEGVIEGLKKAVILGYPAININYDLVNLQKWGDDEWKAKKKDTQKYKNCILEYRNSGVNITFSKIKAHSGNQYNEIADMLAKRALGIRKIDNMDAIPDRYKSLMKPWEKVK